MRRIRRFRYVLPSAALVVLLAGGGFAAVETDTVSSFAEGMWWALGLITTVGFVGATPATTGGQLIAAALMIFGFALLSLTTAALASLFVRTDETPSEERDAAFETEILRELRALRERLDGLEERGGSGAPPDVPVVDLHHDAGSDGGEHERGERRPLGS